MSFSAAQASTAMAEFAVRAGEIAGRDLRDPAALHAWSVAEPEAFWALVIQFTGIIFEGSPEPAMVRADHPRDVRFFPAISLNYAENLLRRTDEADALIASGEGRMRRSTSFAELRERVRRCRSALRARGIVAGDRVAGFMPNVPETIVAMLATASLGAVWSSCSPDFGVDGVVDRFGQIEPKVLFAADGYYYGGKVFVAAEKLRAIVARIPSVHTVVLTRYVGGAPTEAHELGIEFESFLNDAPEEELTFTRVPFRHPLFIMYSSGTTGAPKCIVHGHGGTLLQHQKEHLLHCDIRANDRVFWFSTCGWMMWNWLASALATGASIVLYDGSPFHPRPHTLWDMAAHEGVTFFGTSAKYIDALRKVGYAPRGQHDLSRLRTLGSTGSPLLPEAFDFIAESIGPDIHIASISGGTDIISCFVLGNPLLPVQRGEIQCRGLGMDVAVLDESGAVLRDQPGELVCRNAFPSMPVGFWNDPDGKAYDKAYFQRFPGVWCHGDWTRITASGGAIIYGRSDAVLNPGGVRIGTAEIYRQVEKLDEVEESLCIGQDWKDDVRVVLFVRLRQGVALTAELEGRIRKTIRENTTPRHVPAVILTVPDIPRTKSGKITELAVRDVVHGRPIKNREALANPDALDFFAHRPELLHD
jgi:acetoacetyl-CoA synthetase